MRKTTFIIMLFVAAIAVVSTASSSEDAQQRANHFLNFYSSLYQKVYVVVSEAYWKASTDVKDVHTGEQIGADKAYSAFVGAPAILNETRDLLGSRGQLDPLSVRQLEKILYIGAHSPGTAPQVVNDRVIAEANQAATLNGFQFCAEKKGDVCETVVTPNQIDDVLVNSRDLAERKKMWEISKQTGPVLKPGLVELQRLRNRIATETGYSSYFALEVSDYGMTVPEMMELNEKIVTELKPLYSQIHTWTKYTLAERYNRPVPKRIPAHWLNNRWAQSWPGLVEGIDLDPLFKEKSNEWIIQQAERFYTSLGMPALPESFYKKSDLYELPADATRKKNTHASAWHMDLDQDVRSLMSVKPNFRWFQTTHHELGHIYYYLAYSNPDVPLTLREGANRAFHEALGDLIGIAAQQVPYMRSIGVLPESRDIDQIQWLMEEAMDSIVFIPWSSGVMTHWEHDLYEENLDPGEYNKRWWDYVAKYQGVEPPELRGEEYCDPATKTHINDDPAQYYDYALASVIKYQLHDHIARKILKQDPRNCNYYGNQEVGKFLWDLLRLGATRNWREVLKERTGEELSTRAIREYFQPLMTYLEKENKGRDTSWE